MAEVKKCPLLVQKEEHKALMMGQGDIVISYLSPCIKDECSAYKDGFCYQFGNKVIKEGAEQC